MWVRVGCGTPMDVSGIAGEGGLEAEVAGVWFRGQVT